MSEATLDPVALESLWREVAAAVDEVGAANQSLYLAKLVLLLIARCDDPTAVRDSLEVAKLNLPPAMPTPSCEGNEHGH